MGHHPERLIATGLLKRFPISMADFKISAGKSDSIRRAGRRRVVLSQMRYELPL
ncbi:hypothetical protein [Azospirillum palustre]